MSSGYAGVGSILESIWNGFFFPGVTTHCGCIFTAR